MGDLTEALFDTNKEMRGDVVSRLKGIFRDFQALFLFYLVLLSLCVLVYAINLPYPWLDDVLLASRSTPWGIFTSLFIHSDLAHLVMNMVGLLSFFLVFSFTNYYNPSEENTSRIHFFIITIIIATVLSNLLWILIVNIGTIGASGLIYASEGSVTGFCLVNFWEIYNEVRNSKKAETGVLMVNLLVFLLICIWMVFYTNSFLSYGQDVNVLIHGSSFVLAFILTIERGNIRNIYKK